MAQGDVVLNAFQNWIDRVGSYMSNQQAKDLTEENNKLKALIEENRQQLSRLKNDRDIILAKIAELERGWKQDAANLDYLTMTLTRALAEVRTRKENPTFPYGE